MNKTLFDSTCCPPPGATLRPGDQEHPRSSGYLANPSDRPSATSTGSELFRPRRGSHGAVVRQLVALGLRSASRWLARLARRLQQRHPRSHPTPKLPPALEFYAEAGAPEGALYLDGELIAYLPGVQRL